VPRCLQRRKRPEGPADNVGMSLKAKSERSSAAAIERRGTPRVHVLVPVKGGVVPEQDDIILLDISERGHLRCGPQPPADIR
jgi:hypothetical protein